MFFRLCKLPFILYPLKGWGVSIRGYSGPLPNDFIFLQVNSHTCVLYPGIPLLAHNNGCFRARAP